MSVHRLSRAEARRVAVRAQLLDGDRLVGKLDATVERKAGVLRVDAIHEDVPFTKTMTAAVDREINELARWLDVEPARLA